MFLRAKERRMCLYFHRVLYLSLKASIILRETQVCKKVVVSQNMRKICARAMNQNAVLTMAKNFLMRSMFVEMYVKACILKALV